MADPHINPSSGVWDDNYYASTHPSGGGSSSASTSSGFQMPDFGKFFSDYSSGLKNVQQQGTDQYNNFINGYKGFTQSLENPESMYKRIGEQYNVPQLQTAANNVNGLIANMPYTQRQATQGWDVNQNQLDRGTAAQIAKLTPIANTTNQALNTAQNNTTAQMGYGMQGQQTQLQPYQSEASSLPGMIAQQQTGWTNMMGQELSGLISQMNAGVTLSEGQANRANQLAMQENAYENAKGLASQQFGFQQQQQSSNPYISGSQFYNTQTGQWITAPKTGSGNGDGSIDKYLTPTNNNGYQQRTAAQASTNKPQMSSPYGTIQGNWYSVGGDWVPIVS